MTGPRSPQDPAHPSGPPIRPQDVDTGFWLWVVGLPLMTAGQVVDLCTAPGRPHGVVLAINAVFLVLLVIVVATFLVLMRHGYRWARTVLTGGAIASVVYSVSALFTVDRPTGPALAYAAAVIIGAVLICGGAYLLHRREAHEFFTR